MVGKGVGLRVGRFVGAGVGLSVGLGVIVGGDVDGELDGASVFGKQFSTDSKCNRPSQVLIMLPIQVFLQSKL